MICSIAIVLTFSFAQSQQLTPCVEHWETLTVDEKAACDKQIGGRGPILATRDALHNQTVEALPSAPPMSGLATVTAYYAERGSPTPDTIGTTVALSSEWTEVIRRIEPQETVGGGVPGGIDYRYMTSVWRVGAIEDNNGVFHRFYVSTHKDICVVITTATGMTNLENGLPHTDKALPCPEDIGKIVITGATGPTGVITATDELSRTITFDLGTEEWTLEGQPWLPETTPTP